MGKENAKNRIHHGCVIGDKTRLAGAVGHQYMLQSIHGEYFRGFWVDPIYLGIFFLV